MRRYWRSSRGGLSSWCMTVAASSVRGARPPHASVSAATMARDAARNMGQHWWPPWEGHNATCTDSDLHVTEGAGPDALQQWCP
jgi:hypothetical protein